MVLQDDNDVIRGFGFVALNAAYLEEQVDNLLLMLLPIESLSKKERRLTTRQKIEQAKRLVKTLAFEYRDGLLDALNASKLLFEWRNEVVHGRIYASFDRPDILKSGRQNIPDRVVESSELYELANSLARARTAIFRSTIFQITRATRAIK